MLVNGLKISGFVALSVAASAKSMTAVVAIVEKYNLQHRVHGVVFPRCVADGGFERRSFRGWR
jgi:hypothetical protein